MNPSDAIAVLASVDVDVPPAVHEAAALLTVLGEFRVGSSTVADLRTDLTAGKVRPEEFRDRLSVAAIDVKQARRHEVGNDVERPIVDRARDAIASRGDVIFDQLRSRFDSGVAVLTSALEPAPPPPPTWKAMRAEYELPRTAELDVVEADVRSVVAARCLLGECGWGPRGADVSLFVRHPGNRTRVLEAGRVWVHEAHPRSITALLSYGFTPNLNTVDEVDAILATRADKPGVRRRNRRDTPQVEARAPLVR